MIAPTKSGDPRSNQSLVFSERQVDFVVDLRVYRLAAVQKTAYRVAAQCTAVLGELRGDALAVTLLLSASSRNPDGEGVARLFFQELLDQELREKLGEETSQLRTLLIAHAFSRTSLRRDE